MDLGLTGKAVVVTGGSKGIGRAIARRLAVEGADVAICARDAGVLEATAREIAAATGRRCVPIPTDMTRLDQIGRLMAEAERALGRIDILVNNAGASRFGDPLEIDDEAWASAMELKFLGYVRATRAVVPYMRKGGWGRIVNVIGNGGVGVSPVHLPGGASNAALILFTKGIGLRLARENILVNAVSPGGVLTERVQRWVQASAERAGKSYDDMQREMTAQSPLNRFQTAEEVATLVAFLASERCTFCVGENILADGGVVKAI
jgi:NAD(P)-dependent dehydrogenase (short-subunit alcohol dehydrogenase family)